MEIIPIVSFSFANYSLAKMKSGVNLHKTRGFHGSPTITFCKHVFMAYCAPFAFNRLYRKAYAGNLPEFRVYAGAKTPA